MAVFAVLFLKAEGLADSVPVNDVPEGFDEFGSFVLVINVVRVLPNVQNHQDLESRVKIDVVFFNLHYQRPLNAWMNR